MNKLLVENKTASILVHLSVYKIIACVLLGMICTTCNTSEVQAGSVDIAVESFSADPLNSGTGWGAIWYHEGSADIVSAPLPVTKPEPLFGVTIDDISNSSAIKDALSSLARRPIARIVFDEYVKPAYYKNTLTDFHTVADIMGEILDSYYVEEYSQSAYEQRAHDFINALADEVDMWEVGNEINGEWLGQGAMDKAAAAYDIAKAAGEKTALTLYYNGTYDNGRPTADNCWKYPEHQMQVWAENNVPERMKLGLDLVLVSFYEEDCENISPDWGQIFSDLHKIFPNSKLGFGEVGSIDNSRKETILRRYYGMNRVRPEFVGGFFWWYFKQDMVPKTKALWGVLNEYAISWDEQYDQGVKPPRNPQNLRLVQTR